MFKFANLPLRTKVIVIILSGMGIFMGGALLNFITFDRSTAYKRLQEELTILARITAARSGAALAFQDDRRASENLTHLSLRDSIQAACIYDHAGGLFASFHRPGAGRVTCPEKNLTGQWVHSSNFLIVQEQVDVRNAPAGKIVIVSDLTPVTSRIFNWLWLSLLMLVFGIAVALLMTRRFQASIVKPLQHITDLMEEVRETNDLTVRAYPAGKDEIGDLVDAFNEMLDIIENSKLDLEIDYSELVSKSTKAEATAVELEARNQQIKDMLSGAAHDLRQPLQAMSIFVDMLEMQVDTEKQIKLVEKTQLAMSNLKDMFTEILDVSRIDHVEGTAEIHPVLLPEMFTRLQTEFGALAKKKNLSLRSHVQSVMVETIPGILERVIRNLVSNAINYTDNGGVLLAARKREHGVLIEVWDTGRGIPEQKQEKIFQKYEQVEQRGRSGYGLGLAIVRQFVDILGYTLSVNSVEGQGSCFKIFIPNHVHEIEDSEEHYEYSENQTGHDQPEITNPNYLKVLESLLQTTVFLVDDDEVIRSAMAAMLESWDMGVLQFSGIADLLAYFDSGDFIDPDIIISDYQLGNGDTGDKAIEEIRYIIGIEVPAFIVTGNTSKKIHDEIRDKGFRFLLKPVKGRDLNNMIAEYIGEDVS